MKKYVHYLLLCIFFFIALVFIFTLSRGDTFVNYGFSYAISRGEIPYKDFNMIITPLAPILYSFGLLFYQNILVYYLEQAILLTVLFSFLYRLIGKKSILYLFLLLIPFPIAMVSTIFPGYNFIIVLLFIIFIYCFQNQKNDYLLGIILGLIFCTKQNVGIILFLPTIYYLFQNRKKFFKMLIGYLIPILVLFLYFVLTNSLYEFINLCFLGLFDFNNQNNSIDVFYLILLIISVLYFLYRIIKDKKNLLLYYGLFFGIVVLPIIDYYHVSLFLMIVFYFLVEKMSIKEIYYKYILVMIIAICGIWSFVTYQYLNPPVIHNYNHFGFVVNAKSYRDNSLKLLKYTKDKNVIYFMRGSENYFYKIIENRKLDYFDLPNYGNYGYHGVEKMKKKIDSSYDVYFVLDSELLQDKSENQQYIKELGNYVIQNSKKVDHIDCYSIYYKE